MLAIGWLLIAFVLVEPWIGVVLWRRFRRDLAANAGARLRLYRRILALEWSYALAVVATVAAEPHPAAALGLGAPSLGGGSTVLRSSLIGLVVGLSLALIAPVLTARGRAFVRSAAGEAGALLPANGRERAWFVAVALSAGVCEELLYRGFLFFFLARFVPSATVAVVASAVVFGAAHAYQGRGGVIATALLGAGLGGLYVWTGSLWPPIALHALIDLRATLLSPPAAPTAAVAPSASSTSAEAAASDRAAT